MNEIQKEIFLQAISDVVAEEPSLCRRVIEKATEGVSRFADHQRDIGSKAQFKLICVLEQIDPPKDNKFGPFTTEEVIDTLQGCFGGTKALEALRVKFGAKKPKPKEEDGVQHRIGCLTELNHPDDDPNGDKNCVCAKCRAEEAHDFDAEPDVKFDRRGHQIDA